MYLVWPLSYVTYVCRQFLRSCAIFLQLLTKYIVEFFNEVHVTITPSFKLHQVNEIIFPKNIYQNSYTYQPGPAQYVTYTLILRYASKTIYLL